MQSLWMLVASFCFALMGVCIKLATTYFSAAELVLYRNLFSLLAVGGFMLFTGRTARTPHWRVQIQRGVSGYVSLMAYFYAIAALPLATAVTLNYTSPLFLAVYLTAFAGQRLSRPLLLALLVGFVGVVFLLQPTFHADQLAGGLLALGSGALAGVAYYNVRELGALNEPEWRTVFYFSVLATCGAALWMAFFEFHPVTWRGALLLLGVGGFATIAQLAMTRAYARGKTLISASLAYSTVVFSSLFGLWLWGEAPVGTAWGGMFLIVVAGVYSGNHARKPAGEQPG